MVKSSKNKYLIFILLLNELIFTVICPPPHPKKLPPPKKRGFFENMDDRGGPRRDDDIFELERKYQDLLNKEKEIQKKYDELFLENQKQISQLEVDKVTMLLFFAIIGFLSLIILGFFIYEIIYRFKNKNQKSELINFLVNDIKEKNSSVSTSVDSNSNSNSIRINQSKKNEESSDNFPSENYYEDEDNAPVLFVDNKKESQNDEFKTLTNDEDIYFASRTDKILYRPYPKNEL